MAAVGRSRGARQKDSRVACLPDDSCLPDPGRNAAAVRARMRAVRRTADLLPALAYPVDDIPELETFEDIILLRAKRRRARACEVRAVLMRYVAACETALSMGWSAPDDAPYDAILADLEARLLLPTTTIELASRPGRDAWRA